MLGLDKRRHIPPDLKQTLLIGSILLDDTLLSIQHTEVHHFLGKHKIPAVEVEPPPTNTPPSHWETFPRNSEVPLK